MTGNLPARSQATDPAVLADLAHEINVCFRKTDDYRVTAAIKLAEAKVACVKAGVSFKDWCAREIKFNYSEATRLAKIGASDDPARALADLRERKKSDVQRHRTKVGLRNPTAPSTKKQHPEEAALAAIDKLEPDVRCNLIRSLATIPVDNAARAETSLETAQAAFEAELMKLSIAPRSGVVGRLMRAVGVSLIDVRDGASVPGPCDPAADLGDELRELIDADLRSIQESIEPGETYGLIDWLNDLSHDPDRGEVLVPVLARVVGLPSDPWPGLNYEGLDRMIGARTAQARKHGIWRAALRGEMGYVEKLRFARHRKWLEGGA